MEREIPKKLLDFLKHGLEDVDDGYEYSSELNRILNSDDCQLSLSPREIDKIRDFSGSVKSIGELSYYAKERIRNIEKDTFGSSGILGFLGQETVINKAQWPF